MDKIYGSALATIVAASGNNANAGLRGVKRNVFGDSKSNPTNERDLMQEAAEMTDDAYLLAPIQWEDHLTASAWNSRGW